MFIFCQCNKIFNIIGDKDNFIFKEDMLRSYYVLGLDIIFQGN